MVVKLKTEIKSRNISKTQIL